MTGRSADILADVERGLSRATLRASASASPSPAKTAFGCFGGFFYFWGFYAFGGHSA
jgi:hypothetical protein